MMFQVKMSFRVTDDQLVIKNDIFDTLQSRGCSSIKTAGMQLPPNNFVFSVIALQQKFLKEIYFYIHFVLKSLYAIASFDEPVKRFALIQQFLPTRVCKSCSPARQLST